MRRLLFVALAAALLVTGCAEELGKPDGGGEGYERVVLAELFTATWCGNCPKAEAGLDRLYEEEGPGRIAVIHWHPTQLADPFGLPLVDERWAAYRAELDTLNAAAFPTCIFGGVDMLVGAETNPYDEYRDSYEHERELGSHLELSLGLDIGAQDVAVDVGIETDGEATAEELELWVVLVEHRIPRPDIPGSQELYSFVARAAEVEQVQIQTAGLQHRQVTLPIHEAFDRDKLHIVAFLQPEDLGAVRQAAMASLSFRAFELFAADTTFTGEEAPRSFVMPFAIENTGTQRDSLEIDLPAAALDLPEGWTAELQGAGAHATPMTLALGPGEVVDSLKVLVTTVGTSGKGQVGVAVRSLLEAGLDQDLTFHFQYGGFSFTATGPAEPVGIQPGQTAFGPLTLHNTGIEDLDIVVDLPASQPDLPSGWTAALATPEGTVLTSPDTVDVAAGQTVTDVGVKVTTSGPGIGSVRVLVSSPQTIGEPQEITIDIRAGEVAFTVAPQETTVVAPIYEIFPVHFRLATTGTIPTPIFVDARAAGMPQGWPVVVCTGSICYGDTHTVAVDDLQEGVDVEFTAMSEASGTATILFSSPIDPTAVDTVLIHYSTPSGAEGFDRVVVAEFFTSAFCANCPKAEVALDSLLEEEGMSRMALVHWHPLTGLAYPPFGLAATDARMVTYFGAVTTRMPRVIIDGGDFIEGAASVEEAYNQYRPEFNARIAQPSSAKIRIGDLTIPPDVTVNVEIESWQGVALTGLDLTLVLMEYQALGIPTGLANPAEVSGVARAAQTVAVPDISAGSTLTLDPVQFTLAPTWELSRLYIVAILQDPTTLEVVQGAMVHLNQGASPKP